MPAVSKAQKRFFGLLEGVKKGEAKNASPEARKAAKGMTGEQIGHFAKTKEKGLPEKKAVQASAMYNNGFLAGYMHKWAEVKNIANGGAIGDQTEAERYAEEINEGAPCSDPKNASHCMNPLKGQFGNLRESAGPAASNIGNRGCGGE